MAVLKSARHHWWPKSVSRHWADSRGFVKRLAPDGMVNCAPPKEFGAIGNGHHIRLSDDSATDWDESFEDRFQQADNAFNDIIDWLSSLQYSVSKNGTPHRTRFDPVDAPEKRLRTLIECLVSLAVRSPMTREAAVSLAEQLRGPLNGRERDAIIGLNLRNYQRAVVDSVGTRGKFVALFSSNREFIFGDGFFHNLTSPPTPPMAPRILAPLTPELSILYVMPSLYKIEPRMMTMVLTDSETEFLNRTVQVYSRQELFFRSQPPHMTEAYNQAQHLCYAARDHWIEQLIRDIPGARSSGIFPQTTTVAYESVASRGPDQQMRMRGLFCRLKNIANGLGIHSICSRRNRRSRYLD